MPRRLIATFCLYRRQFTWCDSYLNAFLPSEENIGRPRKGGQNNTHEDVRTPGVANVPAAAAEDSGSSCLQCVTGLAECKFS